MIATQSSSQHHRYVITVHALKTERQGLDAGTNPTFVGFMLAQQTSEKASLILYYIITIGHEY